MWIPSSTPSVRRWPPNRRLGLIVAAAALVCGAPAMAQQVVFDPRNHMENALQAARQLESLANEARSLAASPYSHLAGNSQALQDMAELARTARGLATSVNGLERQFADLYPEDLSATDALRLMEQGRERSANARRTAADLARTAAELERMGQGRGQRLSGALEASQSAQGQTAAVQSSNQMLSVLAEELAALRVIMLAQARLLSEGAARDGAERAAGAEARRRAWARPVVVPGPPAFDPLSNARN